MFAAVLIATVALGLAAGVFVVGVCRLVVGGPL